MKTARSISAARRAVAHLDRPLALVPTMGALHEGHASLIRRAARLGRSVVVSIFVNPTQFAPAEDLSSYPRPEAADLSLCRSLGVQLVFLPDVQEMYASNASTRVQENTLSLPLCGKSRPGHFHGVCTVVAKLLNILSPDLALFGEKDWQQMAVIRRMVRDLNFPVKIVNSPTCRELDGLAMSSRNAYLTPEQRAVAPGIFRALQKAASTPATAHEVVRGATEEIQKMPGARVDYIEVVDAETLGEPVAGRPARLLAAVFLGKARLIDNVAVRLPSDSGKPQSKR